MNAILPTHIFCVQCAGRAWLPAAYSAELEDLAGGTQNALGISNSLLTLSTGSRLHTEAKVIKQS